jgi:hypothetical protein
VVGAVLGALLITALAEARPVLVKARARLRDGPSAQSQFLAWLEPGTRLEVVGEREGWMEVEVGGRKGYVWGEHTAPDVEPGKPPEAVGGSTLPDEVRALRAEVTALRERADGSGNNPELERLKAELDRLSAAHRDLVRRVDDRPVLVAPSDPTGEGGSGGGSLVLLLLIGGLLGWGVSRFAQRGRDRRQRNRLRF